jgi:hypothetical protein
MTLGRLLLAWLPVAVWFGVAAWTAHRLFGVGVTGTPPSSVTGLVVIGIEALLVTMFGSLWFDSLGHGGWWLLFGLVGVLAARLPTRPPLPVVAYAVLRYVGAGALLAWRLGT